MAKNKMFWLISLVTVITIVAFFLMFQVNLERAVHESYVKHGWTGKSDPLNDNRLLHVFYFPDRYEKQLKEVIESSEFDLVEKRIAVYVGCRNSGKNLSLVLNTLMNNEHLELGDKTALAREGLFAKLEGERRLDDQNLRALVAKSLNENLFIDGEVVEMLLEEFDIE